MMSFLPVTLPRERPDQRKQAEAGSYCPLTPEGPIEGGLRDPSRGDQGTPGGTHPGSCREIRNCPHSRQKDRVD
jgi:hypothetical protein